MKIIKTNLDGCLVIEPKVFSDNRGSFFESFNKKLFKEKTGIEIDFVQDNQSISNRGVIRGLHMQTGKFTQTKLVRVINGEILDVVVDFRKESKTFGEVFSCILSGENNKQIFIPKGFLHGFSTLKENTIVSYKCDNYYNKESEEGIVYNDPILNINWILRDDEIMLSDKDASLPSFKSLSVRRI